MKITTLEIIDMVKACDKLIQMDIDIKESLIKSRDKFLEKKWEY